jgi:hypothetical protein
MHRVLLALRDDEDADLVEEGREVWCASRRTSKTVLKRLLQLCLVKEDQFSDGELFRRYEINEDGLGVLADDKYVPKIVTALQEKRNQKRRGLP